MFTIINHVDKNGLPTEWGGEIDVSLNGTLGKLRNYMLESPLTSGSSNINHTVTPVIHFETCPVLANNESKYVDSLLEYE